MTVSQDTLLICRIHRTDDSHDILVHITDDSQDILVHITDDSQDILVHRTDDSQDILVHITDDSQDILVHRTFRLSHRTSQFMKTDRKAGRQPMNMQ